MSKKRKACWRRQARLVHVRADIITCSMRCRSRWPGMHRPLHANRLRLHPLHAIKYVCPPLPYDGGPACLENPRDFAGRERHELCLLLKARAPCSSILLTSPASPRADGNSPNHNLEQYLHNLDPTRDVALMNKVGKR